MSKVYLASPLGFSTEWKTFRDKIKQQLNELVHSVLDPSDRPLRPIIEEASTIEDWSVV
jgi:nucleoside 2-deoxyribosyltransferase